MKKFDVASSADMLAGAMRPDVQVASFRNLESRYPFALVKRGENVRRLELGTRQLGNVRFNSNGKSYDLFDYLSLNRIAGLLVLKAGRKAYEDYELGIDAATRWPSFSMAKSVATTLVGVAIKDGTIRGLDESATKYLPVLKGSAYEGVSIRNILEMTSGVKWDETYANPDSDVARLSAVQASQRPGCILEYMRTLPRVAEPGTVWNYNTGETHVVGAIVEAATRMSLTRYLSERVWSKIGAESDAAWLEETPGGMTMAGVGLSITLRDYGRFGLFVLEGGVASGEQLLPDGWFRAAGAPRSIAGKRVDYGYMWWTIPVGDPVHEGAFLAAGIFGQHLYINPAEHLAIVALSARPKPVGSTVINDHDFFTAVAKALR